VKMSAPLVFISYCREDEGWRYRVAAEFKRWDIEVWDDTRIQWGEAFRHRIKEAIADASAAVLLLSEDFLKSEFIGNNELPLLKERRDLGGFTIFPIEVARCDWSSVPWLADLQIPRIPSGETYQAGIVLAAIVRDIAEILKREDGGPKGEAEEMPRRPERILLTRLRCSNTPVFGRADGLAMLDKAWASRQTRVASVTAFGGVGKTALVCQWLRSMSEHDFRGAELVFGWSFSNQADTETERASADTFLAAALEWFGDPHPESGTPWEKGARLAEAIRRKRTLLVLDGVEPLLHGPGETGGQWKDTGLQSLVGELLWYNPGLCVITSRLRIDDLTGPASVVSVELENLSPEDGSAYLSALGVKGTETELREASRECGGHALTLTLLGRYLVAACRGDVLRRAAIFSRPVGQVGQILEAYETWLSGKPELSILRLMGIFGGPAELGAIEALAAEPRMGELAHGLQGLTSEEWRLAAYNLQALSILNADDRERPDSLDCHPLVRRYFAEKLKRCWPIEWKCAHEKLYEYYKSLATQELPDSFDEMAPLYAAIPHGCAAGRHEEVFQDIYLRRTRRFGEFYSTQKLGAFGADLGALACFFDQPWTQPVQSLGDSRQAVILNEAGESLRALGRLREAVAPLEAAAQLNVTLDDAISGAINLGNLCQLFVAIGDLPQALTCGRRSVEQAERSGDPFQRMVRRCDLANALHHLGHSNQAAAAFEFAEQIQARVAALVERMDPSALPLKAQQEWTGGFLHAVRGFQYCDHLLGEGRFQEVLRRTAQTIEIARRSGRLLHIGLDHLSYARACLLQAAAAGAGDFAEPAYHLEEAVACLRRCGRRDYLPPSLIARAELHRRRGVLKDAQRDLDEAMSVSRQDGMSLHLADCHLESAQLYLALNDPAKARQSLDAAGELIERTSYHRRDRERERIAAGL